MYKNALRIAHDHRHHQNATALQRSLSSFCERLQNLLSQQQQQQQQKKKLNNQMKLNQDAQEQFRNIALGLTPLHVQHASPEQLGVMMKACTAFPRNSAELRRTLYYRVHALLHSLTPRNCVELAVTMRRDVLAQQRQQRHHHYEDSTKLEDLIVVLVMKSVMTSSSEIQLSLNQSIHLLRILASLHRNTVQRQNVNVLLDCMQTLLDHTESLLDGASNSAKLTSKHSANLIVILCRLQQHHAETFGTQVCATSTKILKLVTTEVVLGKYYEFTTTEIADVLEALSDIDAFDWLFFTSLGDEVGKRAHECSSHDAGRILGAFAKTPIGCEELARVLSTNRMFKSM
eukprot:PhF_6_TR25605/c1_g1_i1/m.35924